MRFSGKSRLGFYPCQYAKPSKSENSFCSLTVCPPRLILASVMLWHLKRSLPGLTSCVTASSWMPIAPSRRASALER